MCPEGPVRPPTPDEACDVSLVASLTDIASPDKPLLSQSESALSSVTASSLHWVSTQDHDAAAEGDPAQQDQEVQLEVRSCSSMTPQVVTWRAIHRHGCGLRTEPHSFEHRSGEVLRPGEIFLVSEEVVGRDGVIFLQLADGRGWVFDSRPGFEIICVRWTVKGADVQGPSSPSHRSGSGPWDHDGPPPEREGRRVYFADPSFISASSGGWVVNEFSYWSPRKKMDAIFKISALLGIHMGLLTGTVAGVIIAVGDARWEQLPYHKLNLVLVGLGVFFIAISILGPCVTLCGDRVNAVWSLAYSLGMCSLFGFLELILRHRLETEYTNGTVVAIMGGACLSFLALSAGALLDRQGNARFCRLVPPWLLVASILFLLPAAAYLQLPPFVWLGLQLALAAFCLLWGAVLTSGHLVLEDLLNDWSDDLLGLGAAARGGVAAHQHIWVPMCLTCLAWT